MRLNPGISGLENFRDPGIRESRDPGIAIPNYTVGIAIPEHFSNPGISGLKNANPGIPGLNPGIESLILN